MDIDTTEVADATVLRPADGLDLLGYQALAEKINALLHGGCKKIVLDLGAVTYVNSPVVNVLLGAGARARASGGALALAQVRGGAKVALDVSGTLKTLTVYATVEDAVRA